MAKLDWRGGEIHDRLAEASAMGIEKVTADCVHDARSDHPAYPPASEPGDPFANRTDATVGSIHSSPAQPTDDDRVVGTWGSDMEHALFLEIGTSRAGSGSPSATEREAAGDGSIDAIPPPSQPPLMAPRPTLRPAADRHYPTLGERIGQAFRGEELT